MLVGEVEVIAQSYLDHLARDHPDTAATFSRPMLDEHLQNAIFVSQETVYVGDQYDMPDETTIRVGGRGFVMQRFFEEASPTLQCSCTFGEPGATCEIRLFGTTANCGKVTCLQCGWATTIPAGLGDEPMFMTEFG